MSTPIANGSLGTTGNYTVTESGGVISISVTENILTSGIQANLGVSISASALLTAWAAATSNATLQAILKEAAAVVTALP